MHARARWAVVLSLFAASLVAEPRRPEVMRPSSLQVPSEAGPPLRSIRSFNTVTVTDPAGDMRGNQQLVGVGFHPSPSGSSATIDVEKWFISGALSATGVYVDVVFSVIGEDAYDYIYTPEPDWTGQSITIERDPEQETLPLHVVRATIEDMGTFWRMGLELNAPFPSASEYTYQFQFWTPQVSHPGLAAGWHYPGIGVNHFFWDTGGSESLLFQQGWFDFVSTTTRQLDGETLEVELVVNAPFPATVTGALREAQFIVFLYDQGVRLDEVLLISGAPDGWKAWLASYAFDGYVRIERYDQLNFTRDGARLSVRVPLRSLNVRNGLRTSAFGRAVLQSMIGDVTTSGIDFSGTMDLALSDPPEVVVTSYPDALVQLPDLGGATTSFTVTNVGDSPTTVTLARDGDFFTVDPSVFELAAGASRQVLVTGAARGPGDYQGAVILTGVGVPEGLRVPVRMLVTAPPSSGNAQAQPDENRVDVAAPAEQDRVDASVGFRNVGDAPLTGLVVPDVPWLEIAEPLLTIGAGQHVTIPFVIDRTRRTDADDRIGSTVGNLSLQYLAGSGSGAAARLIGALATGVKVSTSLVTVTDTAKPKTRVGAPGPLGTNEVALFVSSLGHVQSPAGVFISDLYMASLTPMTNLAVFYTAAGQPLASSVSTTLVSLTSARPLAFSDLTKTVFEQDNGLGTLQVRAANIGNLNISASVFNKSSAAGTYGSAVPVLRSDRGVEAGEMMFIPGLLASSAAGRTNLVLQEVSGNDAPVVVELLDAAGAIVTSLEDTVPAFQHIRMSNFVPAGASAAVIRVRDGAAGSVLAYATPLDALSGDTWVVTDWPRVEGFDPAGLQIIPIAGKIEGANANYFRSTTAIVNQSSAAANVLVRFVANTGVAVERTVPLGPRATAAYGDTIGELFGLAGGLGFLEIDPQGTPVTVTSRTFATIGDDPKTFGTGVPAVSAASMTVGTAERISGFDDADAAVITAKTPATFRTNLGLVETSGKGATVRVTIHFRHPVSTTVTAIGSGSKDYALAPRQFLLVQSVAADVLGEYRNSLKGNLKDLFADIEIVSGEGSVIAFTSSVDNGTGDQLFKLQ